MHDEHPHPLLAQVPLTVSPFLNLPTATPLPYTYKQLPSTLPPSILSPSNQQNPQQQQQQSTPSNQTNPTTQDQPAYITSTTGHSTHPDTILTSCLALQQHLQQLESRAKATLQAWDDKRKAEDLAEKRRVAPGWLDGDVKLLRPENVDEGKDTVMGEAGSGDGRAMQDSRRFSVGIKGLVERRDGIPDSREGEELDRAFGGMNIK